MQFVPQNFQMLFPSSSVTALEIKKDKTYVLETLLRNATLEAWQWMAKNYSTDDIANTIKFSSNLRKKDVLLWAEYLQIPVSEILCLQKKSRAGLKSSWAY